MQLRPLAGRELEQRRPASRLVQAWSGGNTNSLGTRMRQCQWTGSQSTELDRIVPLSYLVTLDASLLIFYLQRDPAPLRRNTTVILRNRDGARFPCERQGGILVLPVHIASTPSHSIQSVGKWEAPFLILCHGAALLFDVYAVSSHCCGKLIVVSSFIPFRSRSRLTNACLLRQ